MHTLQHREQYANITMVITATGIAATTEARNREWKKGRIQNMNQTQHTDDNLPWTATNEMETDQWEKYEMNVKMLLWKTIFRNL